MTCGTQDTFAIIKFSAQILISASVLVFSMCMIAFGNGSTDIYLPLMSGIVGYWLPQPSLKRKKKTTSDTDAAENNGANNENENL
jgi:hypothetical protein